MAHRHRLVFALGVIQHWRMTMLKQLLIISLLLFALETPAPAGPLLISIDPGTAGSEFVNQTYDLFGLAGTPLNGQTQSLDVIFASSKFLVDQQLDITLTLFQSGGLGTLPADGYAVSGYLLNESHEAQGNATIFSENLRGPAFTMPDGFSLPARIGFFQRYIGTTVDDIPGPNYSIDPVVFYGIHFDIRLPNSPGNTLVDDLKLQLFNLDSPILISPDPIPRYLINVPEPSSFLLLGVGLAGLIGFSTKFSRQINKG